MRYTTLKTIVNSVLTKKQLPKHYYIQFLKLAADGLRELHFDSLKTVRAKLLPVSATNSVTLPCDFVDIVKLGLENGQFVQPLTQDLSINRMINTDTGGNATTYGLSDTSYYMGAYWYQNFFDNYGNHLGRYWGVPAGASGDTFKLLKERGEIQLNELIDADFVVLEYISDGTESDSATSVDPYAQACIEAYIDWQYKQHSKSFGIGERQEAERQYYRQHGLLRARLSDLNDIETIKKSVLKGYHASFK